MPDSTDYDKRDNRWAITRTGRMLHRLHNRYDYSWRGRQLLGGACCGVALTELAEDLHLADESRCPKCMGCRRHRRYARPFGTVIAL